MRGRCGLLAPGLFGIGDEAARLEHFLTEYWRRRPLLLPHALEGFEIPIDGDELAGLACESDADARIVRRTSAGYELEQGPFPASRFETIGDANWTLLVNGVDLSIPGFEPLLEAVRFVPDWRLDDIMVSFAAPGGSVGPHFDRYDVFLLQAEGTRRWELGPDPAEEHRELVAQEGLALVEAFSPARSERCAQGEGLYVPAGCVHHGIAETPCLTLSIGFRAPTLADLVDAWAFDRLESLSTLPMELDPPLPASPALLAPETVAAAREGLRTALLEGLDDADFVTTLGTLLTEAGRGACFFKPDPCTATELAAALAKGALLARAPGVRLLLWSEPSRTLLFAAGTCRVSKADIETLAPLTQLRPLTARDLAAPAALATAVDLYNQGLLLLTQPDS